MLIQWLIVNCELNLLCASFRDGILVFVRLLLKRYAGGPAQDITENVWYKARLVSFQGSWTTSRRRLD